MPNYIKNILEIKGTKNQVKEIFDKYSTKYPKKIHFSYDGKATYVKEDEDSFGWLNVESNIFTRRNQDDVIGVPEGYDRYYNSEYHIFPDFNKLIPMPESLNINSNGWLMPLENQFSSNKDLKKHLDEFKIYLNEKNDKEKDKEIKNFITGVKNYLEYGHATWYTWSRINWGTKWNAMECRTLFRNKFEFDTAWNGVPLIIKKITLEFPNIKFIYSYADEDTGYNVGKIIYFKGEEEIYSPENGSKEAYELAFELRPERKEYYQLIDNQYKSIEE